MRDYLSTSKIKTPIVILNFKTYLESSGENALNLSKALESVALESGITMAVAPQATDIFRINQETDIPILAQHIDPIAPGGHTGGNLMEVMIESGITGTLLNHSECRMKLADISDVVNSAKQRDIFSVVCTNNIETSVAASTFDPAFVAVEPPELIGSGISVSQAEPEIVEGTVNKVKKVNKYTEVLCGAGISTGDDMRAALDLGASGVLLASGIILAADPKEALLELVSKV
jgi:triosephosphate isomerase (TIM)